MKIKTQAHVAYQTQYHVVWIPKYRKRILTDGIREYLTKVLYSTLTERYPDVQDDHIHMLIEIPPKYAVSTVIGELKSTSSRKLRKKFDYLRQLPAMWSVGYFVSTVGVNEQTIKRYIRYQEKQDLGQALLVSN